MEEKILQGILEEIKGLRGDTNKRFESLENKISETNQRLDSLEHKVGETNQRLDSLEHKFEGLKTSVEVLQFGINQSRQELTKIREILAERVIWNNETITFEVKDGAKLYGTIHKGEK